MLSALRLGNFKAFSETQHIPIRPLTLIFGANSSGKSSLIHGLLLGRHASETGELDIYQTFIGGESVDLGGFRQYIHRRDIERRLEWGVEIDADRLQRTGQLPQLEPRVNRINIDISVGGIKPVVMSYNLSVDGSDLVQISRNDSRDMTINWINRNHPVFISSIRKSINSLTSEHYVKLNDIIDQLLPWITIQMGELLPAGFPIIEQDLDALLAALSNISNIGIQGSDNPLEILTALTRNQRINLAVPILISLLRPFSDFMRDTNDALTKALGHLTYLGPLRSYPPRTISLIRHHDANANAGGGYAWEVLRNNKEVRDQVNKWLGDRDRLKTPYELIVRGLINMEDLDKPLLSGLYEMDKDGLDVEVDYDPEAPKGKRILHIPRIKDTLNEVKRTKDFIENFERFKELILIDKRTNTMVSHRDIGIGISQVLPVLVKTYASENSVIAIEQPEIHLHPALQAELGDVFIQSALGGRNNTFLLETHSEHLILRVMRRMRNTARDELPKGFPKVTPDDVAILYVQPLDEQSAAVVQQLELDEEGELLDSWPGGFFEEGFNERFG